jgi:hypothetical protein
MVCEDLFQATCGGPSSISSDQDTLEAVKKRGQTTRSAIREAGLKQLGFRSLREGLAGRFEASGIELNPSLTDEEIEEFAQQGSISGSKSITSPDPNCNSQRLLT